MYYLDLKDPCVMETAGCHVTLMNAINQSGLMDKYNHSQRFKVIQVQKLMISVEIYTIVTVIKSYKLLFASFV
jgi:hypothetical protein